MSTIGCFLQIAGHADDKILFSLNGIIDILVLLRMKQYLCNSCHFDNILGIVNIREMCIRGKNGKYFVVPTYSILFLN